ncbi:hypothetical protein CVU37_15000, partial [candidate division BRC1 bacterium HGW-BRC1-1]
MNPDLIVSKSNSLARSARRIATSLLALTGLGLALPGTVQADTVVSRGFAEYYILGDEADIITTFKSIPGGGVPIGATASNVQSRVSIAASSSGVGVYLDEWENGYGFDPNNPAATSDARWDNGAAGPNQQGPALNIGEVLLLTNTNTYVPGSEGVDGSDRLYITGAPVSIVRTVFPVTPGTYMSGTWLLYPNRYWDSSYEIPIGENAVFGGTPFVVCDVHATAQDDNTSLVLTDSAGTTISTQLANRGQNKSFASVNIGSRISGYNATTGAPANIQAGLQTSSGNSNARCYALVPDRFLGSDYVLPVPTQTYPSTEGGYANQAIPAAVYVHAADNGTTVAFETATGTVTQVINNNQVARFVMPQVASGATITNAGARVHTLGSNRRVSVIVAVDDQGDNVDWGYTGIPNSVLTRLTNNSFLPLAPVNPVYVTPVNDRTTIKVDWQNDGVAEATFVLDRFQTARVADPDFNASGARIYGDGPFMLVWGQDNTEDSPGEPSPDYDQGYPVLPLGLFDEAFRLEKTASPVGLPNSLGQVQFTLQADAVGTAPLYNINFTDTLPASWSYVGGSSLINFSNGNPAVALEPTGAPGPVLNWASDIDLAGGQGATLTFLAQANPGAPVGENVNTGGASGTTRSNANDPASVSLNPTDEASVFISAPAQTTLAVAKTSDAGSQASASDPITYTVTVTNTGGVATTDVSIYDAVPPGTTSIPGTTVITAPKTVTQTFRDGFASVAYNLNEGTLNFSTNWIETGDGSGVATGGDIQVLSDLGSNRLRLANGSVSIRRSANLSGYSAATLTFDYRRAGLDNANDGVQVQAATSTAGPWTTLATYNGGGNDASYQPASLNLTPYISANTTIRLLTLANTGSNDFVYFDDITISASSRVPAVIFAGGEPANLAGAYDLRPGESMTATFQVLLDQPMLPASADLTNTATVTSLLSNPVMADVIDTLASISGTVFSDLNGNGVQDFGEPGLPGITMLLLGAGDDGIFGTGDDIVYPSQVSLADGSYAHVGLAPGDYRVTADPTSFAPNTVVTTGNSPSDLSLAAGEAVDLDVGLTQPGPNLAITKTASVDEVALGEQFSYEIVVTNNGPSTAENVMTSDTLPSGVTFVNGVSTSGTVTELGGVVTADIGD